MEAILEDAYILINEKKISSDRGPWDPIMRLTETLEADPKGPDSQDGGGWVRLSGPWRRIH